MTDETDPHAEHRAYPKQAGGTPNFPVLEADVLAYWDADDTFRASIARRDDARRVRVL